MLNSIMYKMSYYRFGEMNVGYGQQPGLDRTRGYIIGKKDVTLTHLEEAYTTENWLVRIYKVKEPENRPTIKYKERKIKSKRSPYVSKKVCLFTLLINSKSGFFQTVNNKKGSIRT